MTLGLVFVLVICINGNRASTVSPTAVSPTAKVILDEIERLQLLQQSVSNMIMNALLVQQQQLENLQKEQQTCSGVGTRILGKMKQSCPDGFTTYRSSCYRFGTKKSWHSAASACAREGAHLVRIETKREETFLAQQMALHSMFGAWTGLSDGEREGVWKWESNGEVVRRDRTMYSHWRDTTEPSGEREENCMELTLLTNNPNYKDMSGWNDNACGKTKNYVCEKTLS